MADTGTVDRGGDGSTAKAGGVPARLLTGLGLVAGGALTGVGLWLEPALPSPAEGALVVGAASIAASIAWAMARRVSTGPTEQPAVAPAAAMEGDFEHLSDIRWQVSEGQAHYRDLLDAQLDLIARRDAAGRLTFVNRAFCRAFDVMPARVLGTDYRPSPIATGLPQDGAGARTPRIELLATIDGPRWIAWSERDIGATGERAGSRQLVGRDVTEERRSAEALAAARDEAVAATEAKSRFLARMSHEIRTPMGGVLGMAGLLRQTRLSEEQASHVNAIEQTARELLKLINEILDLAKVEAGRLDIVRRPMSPCACVQSVVELLAPQAHEKGLELAWSVDQGLPETIECDEARCRQILLNLVGNAIKFTSAGGICVALRAPAPDLLAIEVRDTGPGIAADAFDRLFNEFEQHAAATTDRAPGTGLGLAISRHLARALGGEITVVSRPGQGAAFTLTLPAPRAEPLPATSRAEIAGHGATSVLIAVDRVIEPAAIADTLSGAGFEAHLSATADAGAAIDAAEHAGRPLTALIVEARIGITDASALLARMRRAPDADTARGIVIVETSERAKLQAFRAAGFDAYLVRPVRPHALLTYVAAPSFPAEGIDAAAPAPMEETARRAAPYRVLLVEDNAIGALLGMRMLGSVGATPVLARTGEAAVEFALAPPASCQGKGFDIVLMDIHLPGIDGLEATARIKAHFAAEGRAAPPIVALTASAYAEDRERCLRDGLDDFMAKPFERTELEAILEKWCGQRNVGSREGALDEFAA